jgi:Sulfotransferase domain
MIRRLKAGIKRAFGVHRPGREMEIFPDDVFLVSYPKSGNTWTRFLLANLIHPEEPATFANIDRLIPAPEILTARELRRIPRPRIMKSHQYFHPRFPRVICVVRDPRDVAVSQYHYFRKRRRIGDDYPLSDFFKGFLSGRDSDYGSWAENVGSWIATRHNRSDFLLLRYEDMLADTMAALEGMASFIGIQTTSERLRDAVERSSAGEMRKLERLRGADSSSVTRSARQDIPFVRAAQAGGWKSNLPQNLAEEMEAAWGPLMRYFGYELLLPQAADNDGAREVGTSQAAGKPWSRIDAAR